jgi:hypothetical protein
MNIHPDNRTPYEHDMIGRVINSEFERAVFMARPSVMLGVVPKADGTEWCAMLGDNLMENVVGFGKTPDEAMLAFDKAWYEKKVEPHA